MWRDPQVSEGMARTIQNLNKEIQKLREELEEVEKSRDYAFEELSKHDTMFLQIAELMEGDDHGHGWVPGRAKRALHCVQCRVHFMVSPETMNQDVRQVYDTELASQSVAVYSARAGSDSGDLDFEEVRDPSDEDEDEFNEVD